MPGIQCHAPAKSSRAPQHTCVPRFEAGFSRSRSESAKEPERRSRGPVVHPCVPLKQFKMYLKKKGYKQEDQGQGQIR